MLSSEALEAIKNQTASTPKSQVIFIEIGNGYSYGSVIVESENQKIIQDLATQLNWVRIKSTICSEFKDGDTAIAIGNIIKTDLESKGFTVKSKVKAYR